MKKLYRMLAAMCFLALSLACHPAVALAAPEPPVEKLLPKPGFTEGWIVHGKIITFTEKDLYKHINGEAELYYPYGFKALATAIYVRSDNQETGIVADIYEMGSPIDAFGIYSRYRDPDEEAVHIGTEGFVNESQLLFAKGKYFVRLSPSGSVTMEKSISIACAQSIAKMIPASAPLTTLDILKIPEVIPRTEIYITQGVLGYAFFKKGLTADAKLNNNTIRIFVVFEESPVSAAQVLEEYKTYLDKSQAPYSVKSENNVLTIIAGDPLYKGLAISRTGRFLIGAAKLPDPESALPMIKKIQSRTPVM